MLGDYPGWLIQESDLGSNKEVDTRHRKGMGGMTNVHVRREGVSLKAMAALTALFLAFLLLQPGTALSNAKSREGKPAKYVFLFIGDGITFINLSKNLLTLSISLPKSSLSHSEVALPSLQLPLSKARISLISERIP